MISIDVVEICEAKDDMLEITRECQRDLYFCGSFQRISRFIKFFEHQQQRFRIGIDPAICVIFLREKKSCFTNASDFKSGTRSIVEYMRMFKGFEKLITRFEVTVSIRKLLR